jgi:uncharacterized protein
MIDDSATVIDSPHAGARNQSQDGKMSFVVIKAIRACNLRCPYCYYINEDTPNYGTIISEGTLGKLYEHVARYIGQEDHFGFIWHGGEPLMLGRKRLQRFIDMQQGCFSKGQVENLLQTNGVLVDQEWINFFKRNDIGVGLSLDGAKDSHDSRRVTRSGRGTYDDVVRALRLFEANGLSVGVLAVPDGDADGYETLRHFQELGIEACDFLLPMSNNALQETLPSSGYRNFTNFTKIAVFLKGAFKRWVEAPEPAISVRLFESLIVNAFGFRHSYLDAGPTTLAENLVLETNGDVCLDTDFWHIDRYALGAQYRLAMNVHDADFTLAHVERLLNDIVEREELDRLPGACQNCRVRSVCHASHPASRYGTDGTYLHRSAYCEAMYYLSEDVLNYLVQRGYANAFYDADLKKAIAAGGWLPKLNLN